MRNPHLHMLVSHMALPFSRTLKSQNSKGSGEMTILIETTHLQITVSTEPEYLMDDLSGALADVTVSCCTCSCSCCC